MDLITLKHCDILNKSGKVLLSDISYTLSEGDAPLIVGPNGGGKKDFINALSSTLDIVPRGQETKSATQDCGGMYINIFKGSVDVVSLEAAAKIIAEEREFDESEYIDGGVDVGRTGRVYIASKMLGVDSVAKLKMGQTKLQVEAAAKSLEALSEVKLCGVQRVLDRGLKYMSTGEVRRVMLCASLLSGKRLLILSDIFSGLDSESRAILSEFFDTLARRQSSRRWENGGLPYVILCMERYKDEFSFINRVIEINDKRITFFGSKDEYEHQREKSQKSAFDSEDAKKQFIQNVLSMAQDVERVLGFNYEWVGETLIEMNNVCVGWGEHKVLENLNWKVNKGEHTLIVGPNGSGKTTLLELITGDNMQVFCNDVKILGKRRGASLNVWQLKHILGIVSYRLHVEYTMITSVTTLQVVISGFYDSIGLYKAASDMQKSAALRWLHLATLDDKANTRFSELSYGEQRAVLILRAAVKCPPILILDEPCHALDDKNRAMVLNLLEAISTLGTSTLLHVTHEMDEVLPCEKKVLQLLPGQSPMYKLSSR